MILYYYLPSVDVITCIKNIVSEQNGLPKFRVAGDVPLYECLPLFVTIWVNL